MRALTKYSLLHLPGIALCGLLVFCMWRFVGLPGWIATLLFVAWLIKDAAFYPLLRRAYASGGTAGTTALVGRRGIVRRGLAPAGSIALGGELWRAEVEPGATPLAAGTTVRVVAARGMTLIVTPDDGATEPPPTPSAV